MAKSRERLRLDRLLAKTDQTFRDAFEKYVADLTSPKVMAAISDALERGDQSAAEQIIRSHLVALGQAVPQAIQIAAADAGAEAMGQFADSVIAFAFDPSHPRAAEIIRQETLGFIQQMTDSQLDSIRYAISEGFEAGAGTASKANRVREAIGLTRSQLESVDRYRAALQSGTLDSLTRELRDRRFDRSVQAVAAGRRMPFLDSEIDRMVARYQERRLAARAETIARTESTRATSIAREETYRQLQDTPGIGHNRRILRVWNATHDGRTRDWHASMQGQVRPIGVPFRDGHGHAVAYPGDSNAPAETVINCRCVLTMRLE